MRPALDARTPNMARVYACLLGGKDHYAADRLQVRKLLQIYPPLAAMARENRAFQARAITWAARAGISQFLDLGAGLPAAQNAHQVARAASPAAAVAYIDTDPVVLAHARALLATGDGVTAVAADLRDPAAVLADPGLRTVIDPARPVAVILGAVLHFLDADTARQVAAGYARLIAPGSCLIITVACFEDEALAKQLAAEYDAGTFVNHDRDGVASFLAGLDLVEPGLAEASAWQPPAPEPGPGRRQGHLLAAVARRP
jgi:O-methyltransferase involved in polyketide biosynthesis